MEAPEAATAVGRLRGTQRDGAEVFYGIPYAKPPVADRRFRPPEIGQFWRNLPKAAIGIG